MSELTPNQHDTSGEPRSEEPSTYVQDPAKAEIMAYASKNQEENVVKFRKEALGQAALIGDPDMIYRDPDAWMENKAVDNAYLAASKAQFTRKLADKNASTAAEIYEKVHNL